MDGNGRWARARNAPRFMGHRAGVEAVRGIVEASAQHHIDTLTLFAFSSENWRRPEGEVRLLMDLFLNALKREVSKLHRNNVRLRIIGERSAFTPKLQTQIRAAETLTAGNTGLNLIIAVNYGGRWDLTRAARRLAARAASGELSIDAIDEHALRAELSLSDVPEPDLFIRTGGEQRISNFLLWQLAYTELYFTEVLWPDFSPEEYRKALVSFACRQRRFGRTGEQVEQIRNA